MRLLDGLVSIRRLSLSVLNPLDAPALREPSSVRGNVERIETPSKAPSGPPDLAEFRCAARENEQKGCALWCSS
jgi:hypothetical protein